MIAAVAVVVLVVVLAGTAPGDVLGPNPGGDIWGPDEVSSLQCDFVSTSPFETVWGTIYMENIWTPNLKVRDERTTTGQDVITIINGETQEVWIYSEGTWTDMSSMFNSYWSEYELLAHTYTIVAVSGLTGSGDYTFTDPTSGATVTLSNIQINPSLDDSLFTHG